MEESYIMRSFHSILFCQLRLGKLTSTGVLDFIWGGGIRGFDFFHLLFININCDKKLTSGGQCCTCTVSCLWSINISFNCLMRFIWCYNAGSCSLCMYSFEIVILNCSDVDLHAVMWICIECMRIRIHKIL